MIIRTSRKNRFTVIPNDLLEDPSLDWKDLGLLVYLLSKPDNWEISVEHLKNQRKLGRDGIYKCLDAIIAAGYARREKKKDGSVDWYIFDDKENAKNNANPVIKPNPEKTEKAKQSQIRQIRNTGNPNPENPTLINTEDKQELIKEIITESSICKVDPVEEIFDYWKSVLNHPRAKMDDARRKTIKNALKIGYEVEDLKAAIVGCSLTPHNMGANDNHQKYDGIDLILRNASQIDRFISNSLNQPTQKSPGSATNRNQGSIGTKPTKRNIAHENFADKDYGQSTINAPWLIDSGIN